MVWLIAAFVGILTLSEAATAMPAFARKYNMSCAVCHAPFPRLKAYGDEFAGNGFVLKDKDAPRYFTDTGDSQLSLIRDFPIAARFDGHAVYNTATERELDFEWPWVLKILSGGAIAPHVAYYFYFFLSERGEVAGVEDAFVMFNDVFKSDLDIYLGQFQASDPLFKGELALTFEKYQVYGVRPGLSVANLKYDRGVMLNYGFPTGTDLFVEVLNGNGIGEADAQRTYDNDEYKNFMGRLSQDVGEYVRVGGFGYWGKEKGLNSDTTLNPNGEVHANEIGMAGPDVTFAAGPVELNGQYVWRKDSDPIMLCQSKNEVVTTGGFVEAIFWPYGDKSRWYAVGLFNWVDSDQKDLKYQTLTGHFGYLLRTNFRLTAEFTYGMENEESRAALGFVTGF
ncbi:hypothetical protein KKH27_05130 [bacterium]|nr:hypothetical protein [bacterium]MBU1985571.1 hypothetical protein [bacterium]